jgi:hypothetical protein
MESEGWQEVEQSQSRDRTDSFKRRPVTNQSIAEAERCLISSTGSTRRGRRTNTIRYRVWPLSSYLVTSTVVLRAKSAGMRPLYDHAGDYSVAAYQVNAKSLPATSECRTSASNRRMALYSTGGRQPVSHQQCGGLEWRHRHISPTGCQPA